VRSAGVDTLDSSEMHPAGVPHACGCLFETGSRCNSTLVQRRDLGQAALDDKGGALPRRRHQLAKLAQHLRRLCAGVVLHAHLQQEQHFRVMRYRRQQEQEAKGSTPSGQGLDIVQALVISTLRVSRGWMVDWLAARAMAPANTSLAGLRSTYTPHAAALGDPASCRLHNPATRLSCTPG
jgi:hypothetical protein